MYDTLVVENMKHEGHADEGKLQINCWMGLSIGSLAGTLIGGAGVKNFSASTSNNVISFSALEFWGAVDQFVFALTCALKLQLIRLVALLFDPKVQGGADVVKSEMRGKRSESTEP